MKIDRYDRSKGKPDLVINCDGFNPVTTVLAIVVTTMVCGNALSQNLNSKIETGIIFTQISMTKIGTRRTLEEVQRSLHYTIYWGTTLEWHFWKNRNRSKDILASNKTT